MNPQLPNKFTKLNQDATPQSSTIVPGPVNNSSIMKFIIILVAVTLVLVGIFLAVHYLNNQTKKSVTTSNVPQVTTDTKTTQPSTSQIKTVETQLNDVDADLTALDNDLASLDSSLNDKQGDLSE